MGNNNLPSIFHIGADNTLTELQQAGYDSEELFQILLADHPSVLRSAGGDSDLILVRREVGVPEEDDGNSRWSLDHLFLDRSGVPVLVEVKRATDTRSRREVVAQMLDYAANGVAYWPLDGIINAFRDTCTGSGNDPDEILDRFLEGSDPNSFWRQVEANLRSGRVRMVFVADKIPKELRRIVEFLNEQMRPAEVLAVEVEQFTSQDGVRTLVPRILGDTERAQSAKSIGANIERMTEEQWLAELERLRGAKARVEAVKLLDWFRANGFKPNITDSQDSIRLGLLRTDGKTVWPFYLRLSSGKLETSLQSLRSDAAYSSDAARTSLLSKLKALPGVNITATKLTGWPAIPLDDLDQIELWSGFQKIVREIKANIERTNN